MSNQVQTDRVAPSVCFIDLATFTELEGFLYGGPEAVTLFVRAVQKANWFSFVPISLRNSGGTPNFGIKKNASTLNRSGDYVLNTWFRCQIPLISFTPTPATPLDLTATLRWTRNLMHNLFERIWITFNELMVQEFDNFWLDFNQAFRVRGSKAVGYRNMIGDIGIMTTGVTVGVPASPNPLGTGGFFQCPFPFWYCEDTGVALPVAALPFNDIRVNYDLRDWQDLIVIAYPGPIAAAASAPTVGSVVATNGALPTPTISTTISLGRPEVFAHYAVVHNDERVMMGDAPRDILIKQVQPQRISPISDPNATLAFDIRGSHAVIAYFFAWRNRSIQDMSQLVTGFSFDVGAEWSNYTTLPNDPFGLGPVVGGGQGLDPISIATLRYENTPRVSMGSDYYSLTAPWYFSEAIPEDTGLHYYSYGTDTWALDPTGSTNYSKLANVSQEYVASPAALAAVNPATAVQVYVPGVTQPTTSPFPQRWEHVFHLYNHNIGRVANGSFGHPTL